MARGKRPPVAAIRLNSGRPRGARGMRAFPELHRERGVGGALRAQSSSVYTPRYNPEL